MTLRVGLIGLGMMGRHHARVLRQLEGVELVAAADPQGDRHRAATGIPVVVGVSELLAIGVDYCIVATPTHIHASIGIRLAESGVAALIEKPLAASLAQARDLAHAFRITATLAGVGQIERYNPAVLALRSHLAAGALGQIYQVATRRQGPYPARVADVGVILDLATHDIDIVSTVTRQQITSVTARTTSRSGQRHEDLVAAVCELADGTISSHLVNWLSPLKERVTIVTGERGCLLADTLHPDLTYFANGSTATEWPAAEVFRGVTEGDVIRYAITKKEPLVSLHEAFRDAMLGRHANVVSIDDGIDILAVAEAMLTSARHKSTVQVRYTPSDTPSSR